MSKTQFPKLKRTLLSLLGPSIIFVAISLNGGELLLWPSLAANFGLKILWAIPIILVLQFIINIEIERYTLVTGKSTEEGLIGNAKWLAIVFALGVIISLVWPAWMSTSGNIIANLAFPGLEEDSSRNAGLIITIVLMFLAILVFKSKKSYQRIETISKYGLIAALSIIVLTVILNFNTEILLEGLTGLFAWGFLPEELPRFDFLAALAYGGVAGVLNLAQSEWVLNKKYGAANLTTKEQENLEIESKSSIENFREWFSIINKEHFLLFFCANIFSIFLLSYLGRLLLPLGTAQGFDVLIGEITVLNTQIPFMGTLFGISGILIFFMANLAILDAIGRLIHRIVEPLFKKEISPSTVSITAALLGIGILILSLIFPNLKQPFILLVTSASLSAGIMWLYPPLLLKLNLSLPKATRPHPIRIMLLVICTIFYGIVTLWALASAIPVILVTALGIIVTAYQLYFVFKPQKTS